MLSSAVLVITTPIKMKLKLSNKLDVSRFDLFSSIEIMENILSGCESMSFSRRASLSIAGELVTSSKLISEKDAVKLQGLLARLVALTSLLSDIRHVCDSRFMYFHLDIATPIIMHLYRNPTEASRLQGLINALADGAKLCDSVTHFDKTVVLDRFRQNLLGVIRSCIVQPLNRDIETDLRLHTHTKQLDHMQALNPKRDTLKPLKPFLDLAPIRVLGTLLDIKQEVTHYLDQTFYNLTTGESVILSRLLFFHRFVC
jgi:WASH complex subunit 7